MRGIVTRNKTPSANNGLYDVWVVLLAYTPLQPPCSTQRLMIEVCIAFLVCSPLIYTHTHTSSHALSVLNIARCYKCFMVIDYFHVTVRWIATAKLPNYGYEDGGSMYFTWQIICVSMHNFVTLIIHRSRLRTRSLTKITNRTIIHYFQVLIAISVHLLYVLYVHGENSSVVTTRGKADILSLLTTLVCHDSFLGCRYPFYRTILEIRLQ